MYAASNGRLLIVQELLKDRHTISEKDRGWAVLYAAERGHLPVIQELLKGSISKADRREAVATAAALKHNQIVLSLISTLFSNSTESRTSESIRKEAKELKTAALNKISDPVKKQELEEKIQLLIDQSSNESSS
jgi:hypothetical protein